MDSFNTLQTVATFRTVLIAIGGIAVGFGFATKEQVAALTDPALWTAVAGAIAAVVGIVTAVRARGTKRMVSDTANLPEVDAVITTPSIANSSATPVNVVSTVTEAQYVVGQGQG